jgi:hypothetical protein
MLQTFPAASVIAPVLPRTTVLFALSVMVFPATRLAEYHQITEIKPVIGTQQSPRSPPFESARAVAVK